MQFDGALIKEQGVTFAIGVVKPYVINNSLESQSARIVFGRYFPGVPIVLMAQPSGGRPVYQGRTDIVNFLSRISPSRIPWKTYSAA